MIPTSKLPQPALRLAGVAALAFAAIILLVNVAVLVPAGLPTTGAETAEAIRYFTTGAASVGVASVFLPTAWLAAAVFAAGAYVAIGRSGSVGASVWGMVGVAGVISQNITIAAVSAVRLALAGTAATSPEAASALWVFHDALFTLNGTFLAMALVGLSLGGRGAGIIPSWHAGLGLLAAALQFASATLTPLVIDGRGPLGLIGLAGWLIWVGWLAIFGIALIRLRPGRGAALNARTATSGASA